jgi:acetolactate synthase-1/2/3 large subunit
VHAARRITAELIVECLENEGVTHVFGIPGEENIRLVDALWAQLESSMIPCGFTR